MAFNGQGAASGAASGAAAGTAIMPGWGTAIGAVAGGALGAFSKSKTKSLNPNLYNAYGETNRPNTAAIASRDNILNTLNDPSFRGSANGATNDYIGSLRSAAGSPGLSSAYQYALGGVRGNNLSNPAVDQYAQQAYQAQVSQGANAAARTRALMARGGVGFSTGNQQAQAADAAAAAGQGALARSNILTQNRQFERGLQQQDVGLLDQQVGQQAQYLGAIPGAMYAPLQSQAGLTTSLLAGAPQIQSPTYIQQPGFSDALAKGVSTGTGLYDAYTNFMKNWKATQPPQGTVTASALS